MINELLDMLKNPLMNYRQIGYFICKRRAAFIEELEKLASSPSAASHADNPKEKT